LEMIPLEYFEEPKQWLMDRPETNSEGVIVIAWSKGAELSLVLAERDLDYKGIVAIAPSAVVWSGQPEDFSKMSSASSSWSLKGEPLPFVPYISRKGHKKTGLKALIKNWHASSLISYLAQHEEGGPAFIKSDIIKSPMLLLSGGLDKAWPSTLMAKSLCNRANENKAQATCEHLDYEQQGHLLGFDDSNNLGKPYTGDTGQAFDAIRQFLVNTNTK